MAEIMEEQINEVIEDLQFELRIEKIKNDKLRIEWQHRKSGYESQLNALRDESE